MLRIGSLFFIVFFDWVVNKKYQDMKREMKNNIVALGLESSKKDLLINEEAFLQWLVGFSDGESNFSIVPGYDSSGVKLKSFRFVFSIRLHVDDKDVLVYICDRLAVGNINESGEECRFAVSDKEGILKLISIFDKYKLNTTKYLDYLDFKKAFNLYSNRNGLLAEELKDKIMEIKNGMNSNRNTFNMPLDHEILITPY